ncbi:hypothetical protein AK830_g7460 [Neonectria ditissima]|uniref:Uncharacterized protein n=1 Tax=Neonectria ditissima TaxID=78410 RepID=A0A0P7AX25_9HYPO|nr:hypothetical protein AK830_g7460 [Neonectria ditissima]
MNSSETLLYIALYARSGAVTMRGEEDKYHWAFLVGPEPGEPGATGTRYHARRYFRNDDGRLLTWWAYEECEISMDPTERIRVRVVIGKVEDMSRLQSLLRSIPVRPDDPGWNCVWWMREAFEVVRTDGRAVSAMLDWQTVRNTATWYAELKTSEHRFDGQAEPGTFDSRRVPTWDLRVSHETVA